MPTPPGRHLLGRDESVTTPDGRHLRTMVRGEGNDLVVLEAGLGFSGLYWGPVHERLGERVRVVAYERAGFGGSDPDGAPRDLARLADDLESVIAAYPHHRLVLVGHSWGGAVVRTVAARLARRGSPVHGVVLVDQADEHSDLYFSRLTTMTDRMQASSMVPLARLRLLAPLTRMAAAGLDGALGRAVAEASSSVSAARSASEELRHVTPGLSELRENPLPLDDVPMRVVSGQKSTWLDRSIRRSLVAAHRVTASRNRQATFVPAPDSGHMIPLTEPELVATEALDLLRGEATDR
ncbi:alpha/beta hydrolase [Spiractinospora alimapuensis]|uniref:alpha/beta fold hydrolase n=1 Tax=Spiractinospora alimapuensis TaxID=2820884 RepID=UPI001F29080F|nr:alpha/beta hydrolase [Spiractinospora alimapuensis]QVQ51492.1 alpha/beta hydrolase [Spiractinospora alimapuensis]